MIARSRAVPRALRCRGVIAAGMALALASSAARAQISIALTAQKVTAAAGSSGDALDVTLTNNGPGAVTIGGFIFGLQVTSPDIDFTGVTTATVLPYVFTGNSLLGPNIGLMTGQSVEASDLAAVPDTTVGPGTTVGLGHVLFDVSPTATGMYPVFFEAFPTTSLADSTGADIPIAALNNGSITITGGSSVPEPGALALLGGLLVPWALLLRRRRA